MIFEGKFTLKGAPIQKVWDFLLKPETLMASVPGAEKIEAIDDKTYEGIVKQRVGPISVKLKATEKIVESDPPRHLKVVGQGADVTKLGTFTQETVIDLKEIGPNEVEVSYSSNVSLVGRLGTFGERIMRAKVKEVGDKFTRNLQEKLKSIST